MRKKPSMVKIRMKEPKYFVSGSGKDFFKLPPPKKKNK